MSRHIAFERLHNFRDLGGYSSDDGRTVRWGRLYRSDSLAKLGGEDWDRFLALGVRTVIDLRYPWEIEAKGRVPHSDGLAYFNLSVEHRPYDQAEIDADVEPCRFLADRYAEVALDGVKELRQALDLRREADHRTARPTPHGVIAAHRAGRTGFGRSRPSDPAPAAIARRTGSRRNA